MRRWKIFVSIALALCLALLLPVYHAYRTHQAESKFRTVLTLGIAVSWRCGYGDWTAFAAPIVAAFQKKNPQVKVYCKTLVGNWKDAPWPDLLLFSPDVLSSLAQTLWRLETLPQGLKPSLLRMAEEGGAYYAIPAAEGGYALLVNRKAETQTIAIPQKEGYDFSAAAAAMGVSGEEGKHARLWAAFALDQSYGALVCTPWEIRRLHTLQKNGLEMECAIETPGSFTPLAALLGIPLPEKTGQSYNDKRLLAVANLAAAFVGSDAAQSLVKAGAFSPYCGVLLLQDEKDMCEMEIAAMRSE